jgi:hypothetical protein
MNEDARGRRLQRIRSPRTGLLAIVAGAALLTAACSSGSGSPQVASLGTASGHGSGSSAASGHGSGNSAITSNATNLPKGSNPVQLLDEWGACMRSHGAPGQADPTIDASKVIHITVDPAQNGGWTGQPSGNNPNTGAGLYCIQYIQAAQKLLGFPAGLDTAAGPDIANSGHGNPAALVTYSACMRANGLPDFPDPSGGNLEIHMSIASDLNPLSPTFQKAAKLCAKETGVKGIGTPETYPGMVYVNGTPLNAGM